MPAPTWFALLASSCAPVVGPYHTYASYGGLVAGYNNSISAAYAAVSGGRSNTAGVRSGERREAPAAPRGGRLAVDLARCVTWPTRRRARVYGARPQPIIRSRGMRRARGGSVPYETASRRWVVRALESDLEPPCSASRRS